MGEQYELLRDPQGRPVGMWMADEEYARDRFRVLAALTLKTAEDGRVGEKATELPEDDELTQRAKVRALFGEYKVVPNELDDRGGFFALFGTQSQLAAMLDLLPLLAAVDCGDLGAVREFLAKSPDVNIQFYDGRSPLRLATASGHLEIARLLLGYGADVNSATSGFTVLHSAAWNGHSELAKLLVAKGAAINSRNTNGLTPLHAASEHGHVGVLKVLLESGADPNVANVNGVSPLHLAARGGNSETVRELLRHSADPNAARWDMATPLHLAAYDGLREVALLLLGSGADPTLRTASSASPAAEAASPESQSDATAAEAAVLGGHPELAKLIREYSRQNSD